MKGQTRQILPLATEKTPVLVYMALPAMLVAMVLLGGLGFAGAAVTQGPDRPKPVADELRSVLTISDAPWCGPAWITETVAEQYGLLDGVAVVATNDIWAVGGAVATTGTLTEHWDGTSWSEVPSPNIGSSTFFYAVAAISANDVWAVGNYSQSSPQDYRTLTEHWDGTQWSIVSSPNVSNYAHALTAVAAISTNDVWAAGTYSPASTGPTQTLIEHWNGTNWSVVTSANVGTYYNSLAGIAAASADDVWAVGTYLESGSGISYTMIEHWNGTNWSVVTSPNVETSNSLNGVTVVSANDVWAVGNNSTSTLVEHWDGIGWSVVPSANVGTAQNVLYAIAAASANDIWAVGSYNNNSYPHSTLIEHWNGSNWSVVSSLSPGDSYNLLQSVAVVSPNDVWGVGTYNFNFTNPFEPLIEQYNPCTPSPTPGASPTACTIHFSDVPQGSTFYPFIRCLACLGLINGYPDGTFKPSNNVTRGQLSKIVSNAAGFNENQSTQMFQDAAVGSTFFQYIGRLASRGFISGYPCGGLGEPCGPGNLPYFRPNSQATRGQISKIVSNAAGFNDDPTGQQFQDVLPGSTYYTYTYRLVSRNVMSGYPCGTAPAGPCLPPHNWPYFVPNNNATRGQTSKIVSNTFFPNCSLPVK